MSHSLFLFDDAVARSWEPFSLTRPGGELLYGALLLRERGEWYWGTPCSGHLTSDTLSGFSEPGSPPTVALEELPSDRVRIFQSSRVAILGSPPPELQGFVDAEHSNRKSVTLLVEGEVAGWVIPSGGANPTPEAILDPEVLPKSTVVELDGAILGAPWDLMAGNANQLRNDIPRFFPGYAVDELPGCHILGNELVSLGSGVEVEPGSVFDATEGPIRLSDGVVVRSHTRLAGPAFIGEDSTVLGLSLIHI